MMRALYKYAYDRAVNGYPWSNEPTGLKRTIDEDVNAQTRLIHQQTTNPSLTQK